uniref:Uncharacterized protein n=2 Tax=Coccidioides posadasii TaxID=199306 RepID=A0A0J6EYW6_COCPO|nr:hypothetical protein CPAG_02104 [Coccidioides posadasii RMSCC 3488]
MTEGGNRHLAIQYGMVTCVRAPHDDAHQSECPGALPVSTAVDRHLEQVIWQRSKVKRYFHGASQRSTASHLETLDSEYHFLLADFDSVCDSPAISPHEPQEQTPTTTNEKAQGFLQATSRAADGPST